MTETTSHNQRDDHVGVDDAERLMTRIIDGEEEEADWRRFEELASNDPALWSKLVRRQQDMLELSQDVAVELNSAFQMKIDDAAARTSRAASSQDAFGSASRRSLRWLGWAAAVVITAAWVISTQIAPDPHDPAAATPAMPAVGSGERLVPEQHLQQYLNSPFVVGELDPIMLRHEEVEDGLIELRIMRRIEEAYLLDADDPLPIDADGRLIRNPAELQRRSRGAAEPN